MHLMRSCLRKQVLVFIKPVDGERRMRVPDAPDVRRELLHHCHSGPLAEHPGVSRTLELLLRVHWWPIMKRDVNDDNIPNPCPANLMRGSNPCMYRMHLGQVCM